MVLREDKIDQQLLIHLDLRELILKDHPRYFIQNVVDEIDFSKVDLNYCYKSCKTCLFRKIITQFKKNYNEIIQNELAHQNNKNNT